MTTHTSGRTLISVREAMKEAAVSKRTIWNWIATGKVEVLRTPTGHVRIFHDTLWRKDLRGRRSLTPACTDLPIPAA